MAVSESPNPPRSWRSTSWVILQLQGMSKVNNEWSDSWRLAKEMLLLLTLWGHPSCRTPVALYSVVLKKSPLWQRNRFCSRVEPSSHETSAPAASLPGVSLETWSQRHLSQACPCPTHRNLEMITSSWYEPPSFGVFQDSIEEVRVTGHCTASIHLAFDGSFVPCQYWNKNELSLCGLQESMKLAGQCSAPPQS